MTRALYRVVAKKISATIFFCHEIFCSNRLQLLLLVKDYRPTTRARTSCRSSARVIIEGLVVVRLTIDDHSMIIGNTMVMRANTIMSKPKTCSNTL